MLSNPPLKVQMPALDDSSKHPTGAGDTRSGRRNKLRSAIFTLARGEAASEEFARTPVEQFKLLMWRGYLLAKAKRTALWQQVIATGLIGLIMGLLFFQLSNSITDSSAMLGLIFFFVSRLGFNALAIIPGQFIERPYFVRQRAACYYQMLPYAVANLLLDGPLTLLQTWLFSTLVYWLSGMVSAAGHYFFMLLVTCTTGMAFVSFARFWSTVSPDPMQASLLASSICVIFMIYSGFLIIRQRIPKYYIWLHYLSPLKCVFPFSGYPPTFFL